MTAQGRGMKIVIDLPIISGNKLLRMHWTKRAKIRDDYYMAIIEQIEYPMMAKEIKAKVIILSRRSRLLDKDNLYAGAKPLVDALKKSGLIWDDSPRWINLKVRQVIDAGNPRTEIEIT